MGYGSLDEMTAEQQAEGEQRAWQLFGGQSVSPASALTVPVPLEASSNEAEDMQKPEIAFANRSGFPAANNHTSFSSRGGRTSCSGRHAAG